MPSLNPYNLQNHFEGLNTNVEIEFVTPERAEYYLSLNFSDNRNLSDRCIQDLTSEMRSGRFTLSDSAICFDTRGELVNGQHRLSAIVRSKTIQPLLILKNVPDETKLILDVGRVRRMDDRITISGTKITKNYCAAVRHAMCTIGEAKTMLGTTEFSKPRHDKEVATLFRAHSDFFDKLTQLKFGSCRTFWLASALKIFVQMEHNKGNSRRKDYLHKMDSFERAIHWLNITCTGMAGDIHGIPQSINPEDRAAQFIWKTATERLTAQNKTWSDAYSWGLTVSAAYHFMMGTSPSFVKKITEDPFSAFRKIKPTNKLGFGQ
jgi:hypothetical protein